LNGDEERELDRVARDGLKVGQSAVTHWRLQQRIGIGLHPRESSVRRRASVIVISGARGTAANEVDTHVRRDPVQPGADPGAGLVAPAPRPGAHERFLNEIVRVVERADHPVAVYVQLSTMALCDASERIRVA